MRPLFLFSFVVLLAGCGAAPVQEIIDGRKVDYRRDEYQESRELQYPPDVISSRQDDSRLLSEYRIQAVPEIGQRDEVEIDDARKVYYRREGNLRWIDLDLPPDDVWILTRQFWESLNFALAREEPEVGTMETEWLDLRQAPPTSGLGGIVDNFLNRVRDSGTRDKFITRVEGGEESTSVFVAHRHSSAQFDREGLFAGYAPRPSDSQLETEMLRRIMIFAAGAPEDESYEEAFGDQIAAAEEAGDDYNLDGTILYIAKPPAESWLLVRIGLDRGGFTIEDQDHTERAYYIQHSGGPESQQIFGKAETNFFNKLFGEEKPILREIKLTLQEEEDGAATSVRVEAADEEGELTEAQKSVLLELLGVNLP